MNKILKIIAIIMGVVILWIFGVALCWGIFFHGERDVDKYGEFENYLGYSGLAIFPKDVPSENIESYYYLNRDMPLDPMCEIYVKCTYNEEEYEKEVERLKKIPNIRFDEERFNYDAYVSMYNYSSCYEYALLLEDEKSIAYINTQGIYGNPLLGLRFDKEYLPEDFMKNIEYTGDRRINFSIYY